LLVVVMVVVRHGLWVAGLTAMMAVLLVVMVGLS
jgi:hypothetical protein